MKRIFTSLFLALLTSVSAWAQIQVNNESQLADAIEAFNADENDLTIELTGDITLSKALPELTANGTLTILGNNKTIDAAVKEEDKGWSLEATQGQRRIFTIVHMQEDNSFTMIIKDLTMTGGYNIYLGNPGSYGGAISNTRGTLELINCILDKNSASFGGAIINRSGNLTLTRCTFSDNYSNSDGGAINNDLSTCIAQDCIFTGNKCGQSGGAIYSKHTSDHKGPAGIYTNCLFDGNKKTYSSGGGGAFCYYTGFDYEGTGPQFINSTFTATNEVTGDSYSHSKGGNIFSYLRNIDNPDVEPAFYNCILENADNGWDMVSGDDRSDEYQEGFPSIIYLNCLTNREDGALNLNINSDKNVYAANLLLGSDFIPLKGSPAIDAGENTFYNGSDYDLSGIQRRIEGKSIDIGCYESAYREEPVINYHTVHLELGGTIHANYRPGGLTIAEGEQLYLQFGADDPVVNAADILFLVDSIETSFKNLGDGRDFTYFLTDIHKDRHVVIALREYTVTLPEVDGAMTEPTAGTHNISYGKAFTFSILPDESQNPDEVKVYVNGTLLERDTENSSLKRDPVSLSYRIEKVIGPIEITVEGLNPTSNAKPTHTKLQLSSVNGQLIIETVSPQKIQIYNIHGVLEVTRIVNGKEMIALHPGVYIVKVEEQSLKVLIGNE